MSTVKYVLEAIVDTILKKKKRICGIKYFLLISDNILHLLALIIPPPFPILHFFLSNDSYV